jgi:hypothetical protein
MKDEQLIVKMGDQEESKDGKVRTLKTLPTKTIVEFKFIKPHHLCAAPTQLHHALSYDLVTFSCARILVICSKH